MKDNNIPDDVYNKMYDEHENHVDENGLDEQYKDPLCAITFQISQDGEIDLLAFWDEEVQPTEMFAQLLQNLTSAQLNAMIVKSLLEIAKTQPESSIFIMNMLNIWKDIVVKTTDEPLVSPTQVFGLTKPR